MNSGELPVPSELLEYENAHASNAADIRLDLHNGLQGLLRVSDAGRLLEFFGDEGTYWASSVDDRSGFFTPIVRERVGYHAGFECLAYNERVVYSGQGFDFSPPYAVKIVDFYLQNSDVLHREMWSEQKNIIDVKPVEKIS